MKLSPARLAAQTFSSLRVRNYRLYFFGQIISTSGTFMQQVAQAWLVLSLTHSGKALGLATAMQYLPILLLGPYGGVVTDRIPKRRILFFTQSISGVLALVLGLLVATGLVRVWMVYILAACLGLVNVFDNPTRQTFHMELVGPDNVRNAVTLYSILVNLARIAGPAAAGILIVSVGLAPCFLINAASYLAVVGMLALMDSRKLLAAPPVPAAKGQIREGFRYVARTRVVRASLLMLAIIGTLTFEFQVSLPLIAQFTFKGDARSYAFLTSSMGAGAALGGLFFAGRKGFNPHKLVGAALLFGLAVLAAASMPTLVLTGLAMALVGVCSINFSSLGNSTLQLASDPAMRGRVMSLWTMAFLGSTTIGGPVVGWCAEAAGRAGAWPWGAWPPWWPRGWGRRPCAGSGRSRSGHHVQGEGEAAFPRVAEGVGLVRGELEGIAGPQHLGPVRPLQGELAADHVEDLRVARQVRLALVAVAGGDGPLPQLHHLGGGEALQQVHPGARADALPEPHALVGQAGRGAVLDQLGEGEVEGGGQVAQGGEADVALPGLDEADHAQAHARVLGQVLLAPFQGVPGIGEVQGDGAQEFPGIEGHSYLMNRWGCRAGLGRAFMFTHFLPVIHKQVQTVHGQHEWFEGPLSPQKNSNILRDRWGSWG